MAIPNTADPITTEVVRNFMTSCAEDMNAALYRSAFSSVIYEGRDSAVALLDRDGDMLGQSTGVPIFIGNMEICIKHVIESHGYDRFKPGDVIILNDPYLQGTHLHDVTAFGPLFYAGELVGFASTRAHWQDIGAIDPGTTMGSTSIYQEGIRLGPTWVVEAYELREEWIDLLRRNVRMKDFMVGDLNAQIAAIRTGERRFNQLLDRIGREAFEGAKANIFKQSDALDRQAIAALPDGVYAAEGYMDDDGTGFGPIKVCAKMTIAGERMIVDLHGTSGPVPGSLNCGKAQTISMVRLAYKTLINPNLAITGGSFPTLEIVVPEHCMLNAVEPAACEWYFSGLGLLADLLITCLGQAKPERAVAAHYGDSMVAGFAGYDAAEGQWVVIEPTAGGWGAFTGSDGESALINLANGSFRNIPVEVYETKHPIKIEEFSIRRDSGGPGRWRGGCGVVRSYRTLEACDVSLWFERSVTPAWGILGGRAGQAPEIRIDGPKFEGTSLKLKATRIEPGTTVRTVTGGGGGYGEARERPPAEVLRDVREGYVSAAAAEEQYGVAIDPDGPTIDEAATAKLRAAPGAGP